MPDKWCWWGGSILVCSSTPRGVGERRVRANHSSDRQVTFQAGQVLTHLLAQSPLWGGRPLSPLNGSDLCCPVCHVLLLRRCSLGFFCLLSCHCLSGLGHCICIWSSMLDIECICWIFSLCLFRRLQGSLLHSIKLGVHCHVMLMLLFPGKSVISVFCRYIINALSFKTFSRIDGTNSIWLPVLQAFFSPSL